MSEHLRTIVEIVNFFFLFFVVFYTVFLFYLLFMERLKVKNVPDRVCFIREFLWTMQ